MAAPGSGLAVTIGRACTRPLLCGERPAGPREGWGARAGRQGWRRGCSLTCVPRYCRVSGDKGGQWDPPPARPGRPGRFQDQARLQAGSSSLARVSCAHLLEDRGVGTDPGHSFDQDVRTARFSSFPCSGSGVATRHTASKAPAPFHIRGQSEGAQWSDDRPAPGANARAASRRARRRRHRHCE